MNKTAAIRIAVCLLAFAPLGAAAQATAGGSPDLSLRRAGVVSSEAEGAFFGSLRAFPNGLIRALPGQIHAPAAPRAAVAAATVVRVSTSSLYNRHVSNISLTYTANGETVRVSGQFNRDKETGYLILYSPRRWRMYLNLTGLLRNDVEVQGQTISLDFSLSGKMASSVEIKPAGLRFTLGELFRRVMQTGENVSFGGKSYRLFYGDELRGGVSGRPNGQRNFTLIRPHPTDATEYIVYVIPAEDVPSDRVRHWTIDGVQVGLQLSGGVLQIHLP